MVAQNGAGDTTLSWGGAERFMATREKEEDHEPKTRGGREPPKPVLSICRREVKILVTPTGTPKRVTSHELGGTVKRE